MAEAVSPTQSALYDTIEITPLEGGDPCDLRAGVTNFQYFEDITSPVYTAKMQVVNTGGSLGMDAVYSGLPIVGGEEVKVHVITPWERSEEKDSGLLELNFYVNRVSNYIQSKQFESFTLELVSKEAIVNLRKRITKKYKGKRIDEIIKVLLDAVECEDIDGELEKTLNTYNFIGNMRKPFTIAPMISSRAIPEGANKTDAGFFLWQTRKGMKFRSLKSIIETKEEHYEHSYNFFLSPLNNLESIWTQILTYKISHNNNVIGASGDGEYSTYRIYFNPHTLEFTQPNESIFKAVDPETGTSSQVNLGSNDPKVSEIANPKHITVPEMAHKIVSGVYSVGCLDKEVNKDINMNQTEDVSQSISRYSSIFNTSLTMTVPANTELVAGDVIECVFPKVTKEKPGSKDVELSGLYIIKELTHYFAKNESYTALKVIRDTSGD